MHERWMQYVRAVANDYSEDPETRVGAAIIRYDQMKSIGWNHFPYGTPKDYWRDKKLKKGHVVHAETHALLNAGKLGAKGSTLYCTHHACRECAVLIVATGVLEIVCPQWDGCTGTKESIEEAKLVFSRAGVEVNYV